MPRNTYRPPNATLCCNLLSAQILLSAIAGAALHIQCKRRFGLESEEAPFIFGSAVADWNDALRRQVRRHRSSGLVQSPAHA